MSPLLSTSSSSVRAPTLLRSAHRPHRVLLQAPTRPRVTARAMTATETRTVVEVTADTLQSFIDSHDLSVIDFYTTWCGPCKMMEPQVERMSQEFGSVAFAKFDCGAKPNQAFAVSLGIKALPTFQIYRGSEKVCEMTGAKTEQLRRLVAKELHM